MRQEPGSNSPERFSVQANLEQSFASEKRLTDKESQTKCKKSHHRGAAQALLKSQRSQKRLQAPTSALLMHCITTWAPSLRQAMPSWHSPEASCSLQFHLHYSRATVLSFVCFAYLGFFWCVCFVVSLFVFLKFILFFNPDIPCVLWDLEI